MCHDEWLTEAEYLNHTCAKTGYTPERPEHLINSTTPDFAAIQQAAIERGAADDSPVPNTPPSPEPPAAAVTLG